MDDAKNKLREKLKIAEVAANEKEGEVILLLLKHRYGLYAAEVARSVKLSDTKVRASLYGLREKGVLESKEVESLVSQNIAHGYKLSIPGGCKIMSSSGQEVPFEKGGVTKISDTDIVVDQEGFRIPFQRGSGSQRSVMFKIKKEFFEILSQT